MKSLGKPNLHSSKTGQNCPFLNGHPDKKYHSAGPFYLKKYFLTKKCSSLVVVALIFSSSQV